MSETGLTLKKLHATIAQMKAFSAPPPVQVFPSMIERCAQALLNSVVQTWSGVNKPWDEAEEWSRDIARKNARAGY